MNLSLRNIDVVQRTFRAVAANGQDAAELFYARLFETAPHLRALFHYPIPDQAAKLMLTLHAVVDALDDFERIRPAVEALGARHRDYGVEAADYHAVGDALIWTLRQGLGDAFDRETEAAWTATYATLSTIMIAAASPPPQGTPDA